MFEDIFGCTSGDMLLASPTVPRTAPSNNFLGQNVSVQGRNADRRLGAEGTLFCHPL
jgi:hypothetical protein